MVGRNVQRRSTWETFEVIMDVTYVAVVTKAQNCTGQCSAAGRLVIIVGAQEEKYVSSIM